MATTTLVSLEDYLRTDYDPDVEYIDGQLKEKPVVQWTHSNLQVSLSSWSTSTGKSGRSRLVSSLA